MKSGIFKLKTRAEGSPYLNRTKREKQRRKNKETALPSGNEKKNTNFAPSVKKEKYGVTLGMR